MKLIASTCIYCGGVGAALSLAGGKNGQFMGLALLGAGLFISFSFVLLGRWRQA
jgi:hypothetical protein